jgi:ferredoxin
MAELGAMRGSGGLVVLDETDCMVDMARYFLSFTQKESCGKCTFCRIGTRRMLDILDRLCTGKGKAADLDELEKLAGWTKKGSLCGLGQTAPNPILTTLHYFREEYEAHVAGHCPTGKCMDLITYTINDKCIGCTLCAQKCPVDAIEFRPHEQHDIIQELCIKCDTCRLVCPADAVIKR